MPNKDFFSDSSIVPAKGTKTIAPYQPNQMNAAMLLAAADKNTQMQLTKAAISDQCRALLACSAMENVLMLSVMEAHCCQTAPSGEQRYKAIVDAYTIGAVNAIAQRR